MAYTSKGSKREKVRIYLQRKYIDKGKSLDGLNKKELARQMMLDMPGIWASVDAARHAIRDVMGCSGEKTRIGITDPEKMKYYCKR